jgi:hypothetical protein
MLTVPNADSPLEGDAFETLGPRHGSEGHFCAGRKVYDLVALSPRTIRQSLQP